MEQWPATTRSVPWARTDISTDCSAGLIVPAKTLVAPASSRSLGCLSVQAQLLAPKITTKCVS